MKTTRKTSFLLAVLLGHQLSWCQTSETTAKEKIQFKLGANYNSGLNYYGRTDSLQSSGFFPLTELWFNEQFYINAAPIFVSNKTTSFQYDGTVAAAGYMFKANDKWLGNIYFIKPFYKETSELVQAALKAQTGATLAFLNKIININGGADLIFSDKTDFVVTAGLDHLFRSQLNSKSVLVIDPSVYLNAGTQQFTESYLKKTGGFLFIPGQEQLTTETTEKFNILSYEFSMPVIFTTGKFQVLFTPAYVIPQNLVTVQNRPDLSEFGKEMFYATIGAKIIF